MKKTLIAILIALSFAIVSCSGGGGGGSASGAGGPETSPEAPPELDTIQEEAENEDLPTNTETQIAGNETQNESQEEAEDEQDQLEEEILVAETEEEIVIVPETGQVITEEEIEETILETEEPEVDNEPTTNPSDVSGSEDSESDPQVATDDTQSSESESSDETDPQVASDDTESGDEETASSEEETDEEPLVPEEDEDLIAEIEDETEEPIEEEASVEEKVDDLASNLALRGTDMTANLDFGRWMATEREKLPFYNSDEFQEAKENLQEAREAVKAKRTEIKEYKQVLNAEKADLRQERQNLKEMRKIIRETRKNKEPVDELRSNYQAALDIYRENLKTYKENRNKLAVLQFDRKMLVSKMQEARAELGYGRRQSGIYTAWANQDILLNMENINKAGWYVLKIDAKNIFGDIPDSYKYFNITVNDDLNGKKIGGMQIPASTEKYQRGTMYIYLEEGQNQLSIKWTNDYYKKGQYDANINISRITLGYAKSMTKQYEKGVRTAHQYSEVNGRFFWDNDSVRTYWAGQRIGFNYKDLQPGKYRIIVQAKNYGEAGLADNYKEFKVDVDPTSGESITLSIEASDDQYKTARGDLSLSGGDTTIYLTWTNDSYRKGQYDANIQYRRIRLKRVGDLEDSALTAYLLGTQAGNRMLLIFAFVVISITAAAISLFHKKNNAA